MGSDQILVVGGQASGVAAVRSYQIFQCQAEAMPDGSRVDSLLAKAEPFRDYSNTAVITFLRKKKSYCTDIIAARDEQGENM